ncbi:BRO family protein [Dyadobacter sp. 676]|uniref:BRO family protein n=1 Tax=Dyadobacter sp. 676 TaxID=3088362 RepID=A0AAU8FND0_9BACT
MTSQQAPSLFEQIRKSDDGGNEFWSARDLAKVLEYTEYRHFKSAIERAREACMNSGQNIGDHSEDILGMIKPGKGGKRHVEDVKLSRYACYLIVQNADPAKEVVALGQTYFAVQTRLQEIRQMEEYNQLNIENEKRLFLRSELTRNNLLLAEAVALGSAVNSKYCDPGDSGAIVCVSGIVFGCLR